MAEEREPDESFWDVNRAEDGYTEEDTADIGSLLDIGYEQLDGFVIWLEQNLQLDVRTAQQDCFNAEFLVDYLANQHHKTIRDINEFELRWFVFSHYLRKANAEAEIEDRLLVSLHRFLRYLEQEHGIRTPDWAQAVLDDRAFYLKRRQAYAELDEVDERAWEEGFREWYAELEQDLDLRCLWLPRELGDRLVWEDVRGWQEATL